MVRDPRAEGRTQVQTFAWEGPTCSGQLSPCATATEAREPRASAPQLAQGEAHG